MASRLMQFMRLARMALISLWAFRLRSLFVIVATGLGIASLTIIVAAVDGAQRKAIEMTDSFGPDAAFVIGGDIFSRALGRRTMSLTWSDVRALRQSLPGAYLVVPLRAVGNISLRYGNRNTTASLIIGATENYATAWNWPLSEGRDLNEEDILRAAKVTILGAEVARDLFGDESPLGKTIQANGTPLTVIGLLSERGLTTGHGVSVDNRLVAPITTLQQRFGLDRQYFRSLRVKFHDVHNMHANVENLRSYLRKLHNLAPGQPDDFTILTADEILKFLSMLRGSLVAFLGVTATVAILVGGFVLANLFYLSVSERAQEIGIRRAFGARSGAIMTQFLCEAVALTLLGALLGQVLGLSLGQLLERLEILEIQLSFKIFLLSMGSAVAIGLIFGLRPARQAAKLDPIQALRS
ncbi:MacB-like periplasmic core domain containing protein [Alkalidesulfovibrio alkalitolerans DSM 16529]|uniref:MacB-like periplasmic core domain containing protein n=1 Tax=Alkalidesulfovibrio alkalitolerans DSM 16529 TaxID=1121439 RepID=S7TD80_9BACT|nr:ABC transporter permease [Alkalidesulfovibrio alkalitolerans]EPR35142.1 MacB-like periplasmic core domain containing protein [Alkalidesulfovibrio alkalitolerans DSM 16529]